MSNLFNRVKALYAQIKAAKINIRSLLFLKLVVGISFIPIILYIAFWLWVAIGFGNKELLGLLQDMRQFVATVFSTQVVAGVLAYGVALIDRDDDGESDDLQNKVKTKEEENAASKH